MEPSFLRPFLLILILATLMMACSDREAQTSPIDLDTYMPTDVRLANLYGRSCKACHAQPGSIAPLVGHRQAWAPRLSKGMDALTRSVREGFNGMPAGGLCLDCTDADIAQLIRFMSGEAQGAQK